jgi:hypothetical protein
MNKIKILVVILSLAAIIFLIRLGGQASRELGFINEICERKCKKVYENGVSKIIEGKCVCFDTKKSIDPNPKTEI